MGTHSAPRCRSETKTFILEDFCCSVLSQLKKYQISGNLKLNNLRIFKSLKLRNLVEKVVQISLKLNFTSNTMGCYGLRRKVKSSKASLPKSENGKNVI